MIFFFSSEKLLGNCEQQLQDAIILFRTQQRKKQDSRFYYINIRYKESLLKKAHKFEIMSEVM